MTTLVFSGGSSRLPLHVGAYKAICEEGIKVDKVIGTSCGSIIAALIASEMSYSSIEELINTIDFSTIVKRSPFEYILNFFRSSSFLSGEVFLSLLYDIFGKRTFQNLRIDLVILVHSLEKRTWKTLDRNNCRETLAEAIRASSSIPILFKPVKFRFFENAGYWHEYVVDGGMSKNFPVDLVDHPDYIGHLIESPLEQKWGSMGLKEMAVEIFDQLIQANNEESIRDAWPDGLIVRTKYDMSMLNFDISLEQKTEMIKIGYDNMKKVLQSRKKIL